MDKIAIKINLNEFNPTIFLIQLIILFLIFFPTIIRRSIKKYNDYPCNYNGFEVAQRIIESEALKGVRIKRHEGKKTNRYSTISKMIYLSGEICDTRSITACALAAHKAAIAIQDSKNLKISKLSETIQPACKSSIPFIIFAIAASLYLPIIPYFTLLLALILILAFIGTLIFIPFEISAIHIAIKKIEEHKILRLPQDIDAVKYVLIVNMFSSVKNTVNSATDPYT
jgi:Zn-dependent membrane protease YugP